MSATSTSIINVNPSIIAGQPSKAIITFEVEQSFMQVTWTSTPTPGELAECAEFVSSIIKQHQITQLLHDVRLVDYVNIDLQRALSHVFCPQVLVAGAAKIVHLANYILPDLLIIDQITDFVKHHYVTDRNTRFEICTTPEGAAEWFKNSSLSTTVAVSPKEEVVTEVSLQEAALNKVSLVNTILHNYKEKAALIGKLLFKTKSFHSNI